MFNKMLQTNLHEYLHKYVKFIKKGYSLEGNYYQIEILCFFAKALSLQSTVCKVTNKWLRWISFCNLPYILCFPNAWVCQDLLAIFSNRHLLGNAAYINRKNPFYFNFLQSLCCIIIYTRH